MDKSVKIENILSQIRKLDYDSRLYIMERLIKLLKRHHKTTKPVLHHLTELNTLGAEIWKDVDIDKYVHLERC